MSTDDQHDIRGEFRWLLEQPAADVRAAVPDLIAELMDLIGLPNTLRLISRFEGLQVYVPKGDAAFRTLRNEKLRREFNGSNHVELARRYGLTQRQVYELLADKPEDRQQDMFAAG